uniref:TIR domain-containing protein n=1 Tax=Kalanchoe fedtschenkoi TaxID=63787 RepID=A0A7N0U1K1_KALFE
MAHDDAVDGSGKSSYEDAADGYAKPSYGDVVDGDEKRLYDDFPSFRHRYDVFLSFRGEDTRETFTARIFSALVKVGVRVFIDNEGLKGGDEVSPNLLEAIHDSAFAIAVISPRYADSRWCLEELATIVELRKVVMPVFYEVDPSDVRRQRGRFAENFERHEQQENEDKVRRWRMAMEKVGGVSGWDSKLWYTLLQLLSSQLIFIISFEIAKLFI